MHKEVHVLGPLLPAGYGTEIQNTEEGASVDIETFLGDMLQRHGKRSAFFVKFFSVLSSPTNFSPDFFWNHSLDLSFGTH